MLLFTTTTGTSRSRRRQHSPVSGATLGLATDKSLRYHGRLLLDQFDYERHRGSSRHSVLNNPSNTTATCSPSFGTCTATAISGGNASTTALNVEFPVTEVGAVTNFGVALETISTGALYCFTGGQSDPYVYGD